MTRIRFEDLPSTNTPRNAENLNKLNNVVISPTEPTTGEEVWIQKGKNLFNPDRHIVSNGTFYDWNNGSLATNGEYYGVKIPVLPNTVYVSSSNLEPGYWSSLCYWDKDMKFISGDAYNANYKVFTTPSNCAFITSALMKTYNWFQLEQGSTATSYEPYIEKKIYTKNDNGVYEEFYNENDNLEVYSTEEQRIGTWMGKPLYRKVINGNLPSTSNWIHQDLGIENLKHIIKHDFYFDNANKQRYRAPFYENANYHVLYVLSDIEHSATDSYISLLQNGFPSMPYRLDIEYTKTTD